MILISEHPIGLAQKIILSICQGCQGSSIWHAAIPKLFSDRLPPHAELVLDIKRTKRLVHSSVGPQVGVP